MISVRLSLLHYCTSARLHVCRFGLLQNISARTVLFSPSQISSQVFSRMIMILDVTVKVAWDYSKLSLLSAAQTILFLLCLSVLDFFTFKIFDILPAIMFLLITFIMEASIYLYFCNARCRHGQSYSLNLPLMDGMVQKNEVLRCIFFRKQMEPARSENQIPKFHLCSFHSNTSSDCHTFLLVFFFLPTLRGNCSVLTS